MSKQLKNTNHLFTPLKIRELTLRNRIVLSPMQQFSSVDGFASDWHFVHLGSRAMGGTGLVFTEVAAVSETGRLTKSDLGIWKDAHIAPLKRIVDFNRLQGAATGIQIGHSGSKGSIKEFHNGKGLLTEEEGGWEVISSSAVAPFPGMKLPKELSKQEIKEILNQFAEATKRADSAGFDVVEIHAAHGYLIHQFFSQLINERNDEYGGSFENRIRFLLEVAIAMREVWPKEKPLFVRLSAVDYSDDEKAWSIDDSVMLTIKLKAVGVDVVDVSAGGFVFVKPELVGSGYQVPFAEEIRRQSNIMVSAVGAITNARQADHIIRTEQADLVIMGRQLLRDPNFALNAAKELGVKTDIPYQYQRAF